MHTLRNGVKTNKTMHEQFTEADKSVDDSDFYNTVHLHKDKRTDYESKGRTEPDSL